VLNAGGTKRVGTGGDDQLLGAVNLLDAAGPRHRHPLGAIEPTLAPPQDLWWPGALQGFGEVGANRGHKLVGVVGDCPGFRSERGCRMDAQTLRCSKTSPVPHPATGGQQRALEAHASVSTQVAAMSREIRRWRVAQPVIARAWRHRSRRKPAPITDSHRVETHSGALLLNSRHSLLFAGASSSHSKGAARHLATFSELDGAGCGGKGDVVACTQASRSGRPPPALNCRSSTRGRGPIELQ